VAKDFKERKKKQKRKNFCKSISYSSYIEYIYNNKSIYIEYISNTTLPILFR
jgi:hypothetical protein